MPMKKQTDLKEIIEPLVDEYLKEKIPPLIDDKFKDKIRSYRYFLYGLVFFIILSGGVSFFVFDLFGWYVSKQIEKLAKEEKLQEPLAKALSKTFGESVKISYGSFFRLGKNNPSEHFMPIYMDKNQKAQCLMEIIHLGTGDKHALLMSVDQRPFHLRQEIQQMVEFSYADIVGGEGSGPIVIGGYVTYLHTIAFRLKEPNKKTDDVITVKILANIK